VPWGVAVSPVSSDVYVGDFGNNRIQYFTSTGSYIGKWGSPGGGDGEFDGPTGLCFNAASSRVYVADMHNYRIQYFKYDYTNIIPTSLGRIKAIFK